MTTIDTDEWTAHVGATALAIISGTVTIDDTWSPYVQAHLTVATPSDPSVLDPRGDVRVTVDLTGRSTSRSMNLGARTRRNRTDGTTELDLASDEALLQDLKLISDGERTDDQSTVAGLIGHVFTSVLAGTASLHHFALTGTITDAPLVVSPQTQDAGSSYWDYFTPFLQQANRRLYCDEHGVFHLVTHDAAAAGTVVLTAANVTEAADVIERDSDLWADSVVVEYELPSGSASIMRFSWYGPASPSKTLHLKMPGRAPFDQFSDTVDIEAPARNIYNRLARRGRVAPVDAIANYSATPGQAASITTPLGPALAGTVQAITWRYPDAEMTVTTRNLDES